MLKIFVEFFAVSCQNNICNFCAQYIDKTHIISIISPFFDGGCYDESKHKHQSGQ